MNIPEKHAHAIFCKILEEKFCFRTEWKYCWRLARVIAARGVESDVAADAVLQPNPMYRIARIVLSQRNRPVRPLWLRLLRKKAPLMDTPDEVIASTLTNIVAKQIYNELADEPNDVIAALINRRS